MQPRQPDGVQPRVRRHAPDVPGIPPLVEDWQVHPSEVEAIAGSPDDRADARRIKVELRDRRRRERVVRRAVISGGVDAGRRVVRVKHRLELHIECGVRKRQALLQVVAEPDDRPCRRFQLSVQVNSLPRELPQADVVAPILSGDMGNATEPRGGRWEICDGGEGHANLGAVQEAIEQPPDHVAPSVTTGGPWAHRDREMYVAPGVMQFLGDLCP